jgi:tetratricopeptide (TPR) repeat protein
MNEPARAVFLSYASQDAEAARRIADALRAFGVEVWFDQEELRGGDLWDAKIHRQIHECALFMPVISQHTQARAEGYFRREWRLGVERTHDMAEDVAFLLPVVIDNTPDATARVPDKFREVQWTRLPGGEVSNAFADRVTRLVRGDAEHGEGRDAPAPPPETRARPATGSRPTPSWRWWGLGTAAVVVLALGLAWALRPRPEPSPSAATGTEAQGYLAQVRTILDEYQQGHFARDSLELADDLCQKARQLEPANAEAWALASQVSSALVTKGYDNSAARRAAASSQAERALKLAPESPEAQFAYASILRASPSTRAEAERMLRALVQSHPENGRFLVRLAKVVADAGRSDEALALYDQAIPLPGGGSAALTMKAQLLESLGRDAEAEQAVDLALASEQTEAAYVRKLEILAARGDLESMRRVVTGMPPTLLRNDYLVFYAVVTWLGSRDARRARAALQETPGDYLTVGSPTGGFEGPKAYLEAFTYVLEGSDEAAQAKWEAAVQMIDRRLAQQPNRTNLLYLKADVLARLGRRPEAEQVERLVRQLTGNSSGVDLNLSVAMGRFDEAISYLEAEHRAGRLSSSFKARLRLDFRYDALRGNPQFEELLAGPEAPQNQRPEIGNRKPEEPDASEAKK